MLRYLLVFFFFFKQKTAYEMRISDWSSDVCSSDLLLAGGIDVGDDHRVGLVEAGAELLEEVVQARVAMRLHHGDNAAAAGLACGGQHSGDFHRLVAVVVDAGATAGLAGTGEAALTAAAVEIGRASCRERVSPDVYVSVGAVVYN